MRLYCKLFVLTLTMVCAQKFVLSDWRKNEPLFMARCMLANELHSEWLLEGAIRDAQYFVNSDANFICTGNRANAALPSR